MQSWIWWKRRNITSCHFIIWKMISNIVKSVFYFKILVNSYQQNGEIRTEKKKKNKRFNQICWSVDTNFWNPGTKETNAFAETFYLPVLNKPFADWSKLDSLIIWPISSLKSQWHIREENADCNLHKRNILQRCCCGNRSTKKNISQFDNTVTLYQNIVRTCPLAI